MPESGSESQWEPEQKSQKAIESQRETGKDPVRAIWKAWYKKEASLTFLAYMIQDRKDKDTDKYMGKDKDQGVGVPMFLSISDPPNVFILQGVSNVVVWKTND